MSTAPDMYASPKLSSGSQTQLNNVRRLLPMIRATGAADGEVISNPSHRTKSMGAPGTPRRMRSSAQWSSAFETDAARRLENAGLGKACAPADGFMASGHG